MALKYRYLFIALMSAAAGALAVPEPEPRIVNSGGDSRNGCPQSIRGKSLVHSIYEESDAEVGKLSCLYALRPLAPRDPKKKIDLIVQHR